MQAGIIYGYIGKVEYIVKRMKKEMMDLGEKEPFVLATGGLAKLVYSETDVIDEVDRKLTLEGLKILYEKKQGVESNENIKHSFRK